MQVKVLSCHNKHPQWVAEALSIYHKRIAHPYSLSFVTVPLKQFKNQNNVEAQMLNEAQEFLKHIKPSQLVIALDEKGKSYSTRQFSDQLAGWQQTHSDIVFIIGGPDGLHADILQRADCRWSLSALTFPHPLVHVILIEQLYRAISLLNNHPYHRE